MCPITNIFTEFALCMMFSLNTVWIVWHQKGMSWHLTLMFTLYRLGQLNGQQKSVINPFIIRSVAWRRPGKYNNNLSNMTELFKLSYCDLHFLE